MATEVTVDPNATLGELEVTLHVARRKNHDTATRRDEAYAVSINWYQAVSERIPGHIDVLTALLDEVTGNLDRRTQERWQDTTAIEARIDELRGPGEMLFIEGADEDVENQHKETTGGNEV